MKISLAILFLTFATVSCSGVKMITPERRVAENVDTSKLYKQTFLQKINAIKEKVRLGKGDVALKDLAAMPEDGLSLAERATRKNLIGVINFSKKNFEVATKNFEEALSIAKEDPGLESQIGLNLGSAF